MNSIFENFYIGDLLLDKELKEILSTKSSLNAVILFEKKLAEVQGKLGIIPLKNSQSIKRSLEVNVLKKIKIKKVSTCDGVIIPYLLKEIKSKCLNSDDAQYLHYGVTSQDAIDTARNLQIYRFLSYLEKRLDELLIYAANQSNSFKNLLIVARTRGQISTLTTLGARYARIFSPLLQTLKKIFTIKNTQLNISLGGSSGTLNILHRFSLDLNKELSKELNLSIAEMPWHNNRENIVDLASVLTSITSILGKFGHDVMTMSQSEVREIKILNSGTSSAMPHKNNPILAEKLIAFSEINLALNSIISSSMIHRGERDGIALTKEIITFQQIMYCSGLSSILAFKLFKVIIPNQVNIKKIIKDTHGVIYSETAVYFLSKFMNKNKAEKYVSTACHLAKKNKSTFLHELKKKIPKNIDVYKIILNEMNIVLSKEIVKIFYSNIKKNINYKK